VISRAIARLAKSLGVDPYIEAASSGRSGTPQELQKIELELYTTTRVAEKFELKDSGNFERAGGQP
jgi:hypothetical protein